MWFLDLFTTGNGYGTQWADSEYSALVARAKDSSDPEQRTGTLAECEKRLLRAMPVMPMDHWVTADRRNERHVTAPAVSRSSGCSTVAAAQGHFHKCIVSV